MKKRYNVILDTDIGNSWDDQFALAYLLKSKDLFDIEAITIEPFRHNNDELILDNEKTSYNEILRIGKLLNIDLSDITYKFSNNQSVQKIVEVAKNNEETYILAIGALTNISLALEMDPSIIDKIKIIWLGGNSVEYGNNNEFNFMQDFDASMKVINSNVNMTIIPAKNVANNLIIDINELKNKLDMNNKISKYLCNRFLNDSFYGVKRNRVIWDISVIAYLRNKKLFETKENIKLYVMPNLNYIVNNEKKSNNINLVKSLKSPEIYIDLFMKLNKKI